LREGGKRRRELVELVRKLMTAFLQGRGGAQGRGVE